MAGSSVPLPALVAAGTGALFLWSGIKGGSVTRSLRSLLSAKPHLDSTLANPISGTGNIGASGSLSGGAIASDAMQYRGAGYVWGGAPARGIGNWDCSSFCNWVLGHDLGLAIPGYAPGAYTGASHGPVTGEWLLWGGCTTISHSGRDAQPGDLCVWQTHMGIALGGGQMISAQTTQNGTQVSGIDGFIPEFLFVRRLTAGPVSGTTQAPGTVTAGGRG